MTLKVIAYARNGHTDKFGIPRQSREESPILTRIVFEPEYAVKEALRGIEGFSHLWILWGFNTTEWSPTVRPPRLGGNKRMGVFATRSPFRPNPVGLSSVRLIKVENGDLIVSGADVMDGTPIYDIKPYLSFSDCHEDARNGFAEETKYRTLEVVYNGHVLFDGQNYLEHLLPSVCLRDYIGTPSGMPYEKLKEICYILSQDPRPGYQDDPERAYKMDYAGWCVTFRVQDGTVFVEKIEKTQK